MGPIRPLMSLCVAILATAGFLFAPNTVLADIEPGIDFFATQPGTFLTLSLPPGVFGTGSDPVAGQVNLTGAPIGPGNTDTKVARLATADIDHASPTDTVPIEIVALSLQSVNPVKVTFNGGATRSFFDVFVTLSDLPQQPGSITITKTDAQGGTFVSVLPVVPKLIFTPVGGGGQPVVLDFGHFQQMPPIIFKPLMPVPWSRFALPPGTFVFSDGFVPCIEDVRRQVEAEEQALTAAHNVMTAVNQ